MNTKTFALSALGGFVALFILNLVWYEALMKDFYAANMGLGGILRDPPLVGGIVAANILMILVITNLYGRWSNGQHSIGGGFTFGAMIGILVCPAINILIYSQTTIETVTGAVVDSIAGTVIFGLVGSVIAWIWGKTKPKTS